MGTALAEKASQLGADVTLVIGPSAIKTSSSIHRIDVQTAEEMYNSVHQHVAKADIIIMAAAVADFTPKNTVSEKIKKKNPNDQFNIELQPTKDILASVGKVKNKTQLLIGFALETNNELENAKGKLQKKQLDYIVLNSLNDKGAGFEHDTNKITLIDKNNNILNFELKTKEKVAEDILQVIVSNHFTK
jgi:phosphopantothenoylcysteine decarboxylase/phosphopantothenate--cysteine ligase